MVTKSNIIDDFFNYMYTIKGISPNTLTGYKYDLVLFFRFMKYRNSSSINKEDIHTLDISDIDINFIKSISLPDIYAFLTYVTKERDNGQNARARKVACLKSFYNYLVNKAKYLDKNPTLELESPKAFRRLPVYLNINEAKELLDNIKGKHKERDLAIITLFLNCGLRLSELTNIKLKDLNEDTLTVIGKGNKERTIYLNKACIKTIENYLKVRPSVDNEYLFISQKKSKISNRTVQHLVNKHLSNSNLISNKNISPHKLRHTAATLMYKHGKTDIRALQAILGHTNVSTTQIYTHIDDDQLRNAINKNPLANYKNK